MFINASVLSRNNRLNVEECTYLMLWVYILFDYRNAVIFHTKYTYKHLSTIHLEYIGLEYSIFLKDKTIAMSMIYFKSLCDNRIYVLINTQKRWHYKSIWVLLLSDLNPANSI